MGAYPDVAVVRRGQWHAGILAQTSSGTIRLSGLIFRA